MTAEPGKPFSGHSTTRPALPPQAEMGLLNYVTATSMDEDYAAATLRREGAGSKRDPSPGPIALAIVAVFGILLATAALETSRTADDDQRTHDQLVRQINARQEQLNDRRQRADQLRRTTRDLQHAYPRMTDEGRGLASRLTRLTVSSGAVETRGPGVRIVVEDGPPPAGGDNKVIDVDLQRVVNGLWLAGAEAIAVNGQRLTSLSAIRQAGANITVSFRTISPPYVVRAIGDPDTLAARFIDTPGGQWLRDLRTFVGMKFEINSSQEPLVLPTASRLKLRQAQPAETNTS